MIYLKRYVDGPYGQLHYHMAHPQRSSTTQTPLVLFHQNPKSAFEYRHLMKALGADRFVFAFDTPGYGESDGPPEPLSMAELTAALAVGVKAALADAGITGPVDVFGFHTGAMVSAEIAITEPALVRRVVLSGIPYFDKARGEERLAEISSDLEITEDGAYIKERWRLIVEERAEGVPVLEAAKSFVQDIHALNKAQFAYFAVFTYPMPEHLPRITQPILIVQPHELLLEQTRQAHKEAIPHATLIELPNVVDDVFDTGWQEIADTMSGWLDQDL